MTFYLVVIRHLLQDLLLSKGLTRTTTTTAKLAAKTTAINTPKMWTKTGTQAGTQAKTQTVNLLAQGRVPRQKMILAGIMTGSCMAHVSPFNLIFIGSLLSTIWSTLHPYSHLQPAFHRPLCHIPCPPPVPQQKFKLLSRLPPPPP